MVITTRAFLITTELPSFVTAPDTARVSAAESKLQKVTQSAATIQRSDSLTSFSFCFHQGVFSFHNDIKIKTGAHAPLFLNL
jgi:hypothetical protein